jgi:RHS repeat-associated protein
LVPNVFIDARLRISPASTRSVTFRVRRRFRALALVAAILASILAPLLPLAGVSAAASNRVRESLAAQAREATLAQLAKDPAFQIPQVQGGASYLAPIAHTTRTMHFLPMDPPPPTTYSSTVLADSPVAYWHLDDSAGSVMADAQNNDAGSYVGGFTLSQPALIAPVSGTSVSFNGSTGYATAPTLTALQGSNTRSVEIWFQTTYNGGEPLIDSGAAGGSNYQMFNLQTTGPNSVGGNPPNPNTSGLMFMTWGQGFYLPGLFLADGKRHHLVVEVSGSNLWIYVDNTLPKGFLANPGWDTRYALTQPFNLPNTLNTTGNPILFGTTRFGAGGSNFFQGQFDEAAVYSTALTATQVQNHWQAGNGLPWSPRTVTATPGQNQVSLTWQVPTFNATGITGYVVTPHVGSTLRTPITFNSTATSETISNLSGGTAYTFTVNGVNSLGTGISSDPSSAATPTGSALPIYEDTALADSPVGFWPLGETSGNSATDLTGNANGQYFDSYVQGDAGPLINVPSKATNLSGSNAYVSLNHAASLEPASVTVEAWIKPAAAIGGNGQNIIIGPQPGNNENTTYGYLFQVSANTGTATFYGGGRADSFAALPVGVWTYVVGTSDATSTRIYINGKQQGTSSSPPISYGGAPNFDALVTRYAYPGDLADVAIYSTALTATQIATHYAAAGYTSGPVTNLVATASTNSASLSWTPPAYTGTSAISSYTITPVVDGIASTAITVSGPNTGANIPNLAGGSSFTFGVQASNASGPGVAVTSTAVTINSPSAGPGAFGTYLLMLGGKGNGQGFSHYGFVSRNNTPAMSTWTLEARLWGFTQLGTQGGHTALGSLSGTPSNPTDQNPVAGLNFNIGGAPLQTYFVWPGGSCPIPSGSDGIPTAFNASTTTGAHVALTYDGTTVRGFINGALVPGCSIVTAGAALPAGPFGFMDNAMLSQAYFDEMRVSNTARWVTDFTAPGEQYAPPYDGNTVVLWHFNDYAISKLPSTHILSRDSNGVGGYNGGSIPSTYRDSSGNLNHANTIWASGWSSVVGDDDWRRPYSLGQGVTVDELTGGESKWLCPCTISSTARPVNDATGEFYHTFTDFHIPGRIDMDFTRTYSSLRTATVGRTGYGWTDNYNQYLTFDGSGNATVHEDNGSAVLFTFAAPNTYTSPPSEHVSLVKNGDNTFTLTDAGQNQTVFNAPNIYNISTLHQLVDRHHSANYTLTLSYNAPPDDTLVSSVADPAGRTLTFSYQTIGASKLIQTINDSGSPVRTVSFQYGTNPADPTTYLSLTQVTDVASGLTKFSYDSNHYLLTMTDPNNGVTTNHYDPSNHRITSQDDPMNPTRTTTFDYSNGVTTVTDPKGNKVQEEYLNGMLLSRTVGYGTAQAATWTYAFDPAAVGLTAAVGPNGESITSTRDSNANVLSSTDGVGRTTNYTYNSFSEPLTILDPTSVTTTNVYNGTGDLTSSSRPLVGGGLTQTTTYNRTDAPHPGDVTSMVDADNNTWIYTYDANGYRNSSKDPLGNLASYVFNSKGWMTSSVAPNGYATRQDSFVRTLVSGSWGTATDGNLWTKQLGSATYSTTGTQGKIASPSSDSFESLGPVLANDGGEILVRWQVAATTNKAGAILRMSAAAATYYGVRFDGAGHVELFGKWGGSIHTNIGSVRINYTPGTALQWFRFRVAGTTLYFKVWADGTSEPANWSGQTTDTNVTGTGFAGLFGNASNTTGVKFDQFSANPYATTTYTYSSFGQQTGLTDPENHTTIWHYDPNQNLDRVTDADGNLTTNVYDADNELTQVKRSDSPQTTLTTDYNPDGTVLDQKDGKGNAIQSDQYDSLAHVTTVTDAMNNVTAYSFDSYGNMLSKQDPGGNCIVQPSIACARYSYDAANQLTAITYSDGVTPNVSNLSYDADGQRTAMTDGTGTSSWGWDSLHRLVTYQNGNGVQVQWVYNLRNLPTTITYPGPLNVTRGYDNAGRWTSVLDWNSNTTTFGYDADSNLTTETFPAASGVVDTFSYNAADQTTAANAVKGGSSLLPLPAIYKRDSANQLASDTSAASGTGSYKYTPLNQVCYAGSNNTNACSSPPSGSVAYKYDAADNLTQKGSTQQVFNNADELCWTASTSSACSTPPSGATTYQYDIRGNRTGVTPSGGQAQTLTYDQTNRLAKYAAASTTSYGYNGDGLRMCKVSGSSTQPCQAIGNSQFLWDVASSRPLLLKDGATSYVCGPGGLPLEQVSGSTTLWFHHDQIGSTRLITDSTGTSKATYTYDPYGGLASSTGSISNPFRFTGQYQDQESALYYLQARYFDATSGQFISMDPLTSQARPPYAYTSGDPLDAIDPTGLDWLPSWSNVRDAFNSARDKVVNWVAEHGKGILRPLAKEASHVLNMVNYLQAAMDCANQFSDIKNTGGAIAGATICMVDHTVLADVITGAVTVAAAAACAPGVVLAAVCGGAALLVTAFACSYAADRVDDLDHAILAHAYGTKPK